MLGGSAPGTRLELRLDYLPRQLAELGKIATDGHVRIMNLIVAPACQNQVPDYLVVLHVDTIDPRQFVSGLRQAGVDVR